MKTLLAVLGFIFKLFLIAFYCMTKGAELILVAFNTAFQKLIDK